MSEALANLQNGFLLRGGTVYDGSGAPPQTADVRVRGGRIEQIGAGLPAQGLPELDAAGCAVTPGFVDIHRHHDIAVMREEDFGRIELAQGITTAVAGNCGLAPVPLDRARHAPFFAYIEPVVGRMTGAAREMDTASYAGYARTLERIDLPLNMGFLAGMGAVRYAVKGFDSSPFTPRETERAAALVDEALDAGAHGMSLGVMYRPECHTSAEECDALVRPVARRDGLLCTHIRGEGDSLVESVQEVIGIARRTGVRLNISHFKATGVRNWRKKIFEAIECIENARAAGVEVTADFYPYDGGSTTLLSLLPPSLQEQPREYFGTEAGRAALRREVGREHPGWDNMALSIGWERILLSAAGGEFAADQGLDFARAAVRRGCADPAEYAARLLAAEGSAAGIIVLSMDWRDVQTVARLPYTAIISDSLYSGAGSPHPRLFGAFPRALRLLVREEKLLTMEQAVAKMTSLPAGRMRLAGRGRLCAGAAADILVFDPNALRDTASYAAPCGVAEGLRLAFVNGSPVWRDGALTARNAGRFLRKQA